MVYTKHKFGSPTSRTGSPMQKELKAQEEILPLEAVVEQKNLVPT
jgi:hypothetical protein